MNEKKILGDTWYASQFSKEVVNLDDHIAARYGNPILKISKKSKLIRGIFFVVAGREFDVIVTELSHTGVYMLVIFDALFSGKKNRIVLIGFILPPPQNKFKKFIWSIYVKLFFGPGLNRSLAKAHVLTLSEIDYYSNLYRVPAERFSFVPWPLHSKSKEEAENHDFKPAVKLDEQYVMVSGLLNVDWETIFSAAEKSKWQLLAVCVEKQLDEVKRLNKNGKAVILNDISKEDHDHYVKGATVYALCLKESAVSVGQIRLMTSIDNGVPVVATKVPGLDGYAINGINAIMVAPNDAAEFKIAIDKLMTNQELRSKLIGSAKEHQKNSTFENYLEKVKTMIGEVAATI